MANGETVLLPEKGTLYNEYVDLSLGLNFKEPPSVSSCPQLFCYRLSKH